MAEELSPESKLYVKEEIEKVSKEFKEDLKEARNKATKAFSTVALIVGLLGSLGVYGLVRSALNDTTIKKLEEKAKGLYENIVQYETDANDILSSLSSKMTIGTIVPYGGEITETKPGGPTKVGERWLFCNGASLKRDEYKDLFNVIGKAFGAGDGKPTFNLPDLRGRVAIGAGSGENLTKRTLGQKGGEEKHRLTINEMPEHSHSLPTRFPDATPQSKREISAVEAANSGDYTTHPRETDKQGSTREHENMQPFLVVNYIIKAR